MNIPQSHSRRSVLLAAVLGMLASVSTIRAQTSSAVPEQSLAVTLTPAEAQQIAAIFDVAAERAAAPTWVLYFAGDREGYQYTKGRAEAFAEAAAMVRTLATTPTTPVSVPAPLSGVTAPRLPLVRVQR